MPERYQRGIQLSRNTEAQILVANYQRWKEDFQPARICLHWWSWTISHESNNQTCVKSERKKH